jgi:hypothetical protein
LQVAARTRGRTRGIWFYSCFSLTRALARSLSLSELEVQTDTGGTKMTPCTEESVCLLPVNPPKSHSLDAAAKNIMPRTVVGALPLTVPPPPNQTASHVVDASVNLRTSVEWTLSSGHGQTVTFRSASGQFQVCLSFRSMNPAARVTLPSRQINSNTHQYRKRGSSNCLGMRG